MGDFHLPEVQQFPNSNATIGFKSNPIATSNRRYAKQSVLYSTVTVVFAKNYLKHSKVNGMCVKFTPVLPPLTSPFRSFDGHFFFFSIEMGIKNRREMRSVGLSTDFRMYVSFSVHEIVTLLIYFFMRIISV